MSDGGSGLKVGVIGTGRLGTNHARIYSLCDNVKSLFLYDKIKSRSERVANEYGGEICDTVEGLIGQCDMVSICTPATDHYESALKAFSQGVHVLVEKPIASNSVEGEEMVQVAERQGCILQVGHIERFNGAFESVCGLVDNPMFIEVHRLGMFTHRGTDVSVVVDLMIHDLDLILHILKKHQVSELSASGAKVLTSSPDIVNTRIKFDNGCVANITASRISMEPLRKIRFFQQDLYVSADLREKRVKAYRKSSPKDHRIKDDPYSNIKNIPVRVNMEEPLVKEINSFINTMEGRGSSSVSGREGLRALRIAERILKCIERNG